jgi:formamidopyrimidine-DNA glycosylase
VPELLEVEYYRRHAERTVGRRITAVHSPDVRYRPGWSAEALAELLVGAEVSAARRHGKLLLLDLDGAPTLGLRFGMTGRLVVDGVAAIDKLEYASPRDEPKWERFALDLAGGGRLAVVDPRRLGSVSVDPPSAGLGPEATTIGPSGLQKVLARSQAPLKARMMDQARLAGLGNLLTDEILWRAGLDPQRPAGGLSAAEVRRLHRVMRRTLEDLDGRGGSHTGDLYAARGRGRPCPRCGAPLGRATVGGRTTYWCRAEQV